MDGWDSHYLGEEEPANRSHRDRPLTGCWRLSGIGGELPAGNRDLKQRRADELLYGDLLVTYRIDPNKCISYSRRPEKYGPSRYRWDWLTYATVKRFVDKATQAQLIEHDQARSGQRGRQSRMRLAETTARYFEQTATLSHCPPETIILRDCDKKLCDYSDNGDTERMRSRLCQINEALVETELTYRGRIIRPGDLISVDANKFAARNAHYRVFNRSRFDLGGRFYGPWWQNIRSKDRAEIVINGSRSLERDYRQHHPTLLYALLGKTLNGDAYALDGWETKPR